MGDEHGGRDGDSGEQRGTKRRYRRGLHASVRNNASAYGFSVTITASFGLLTSALGTPGAPEIFAFAGGAVAAFALVEFAVSGGYRQDLEDEPPNAKDIGSSVSVLSVGLAMASAYAVASLLEGPAAWPVGSFVATSAYLFLFGIELGLIERLTRGKGDGPKG
ncbi:MAG: hypothetical protein M3P49_15925 [Actinomycetota bacterium]|nr:hypothetical protein [Actinomycetota bacterium]